MRKPVFQCFNQVQHKPGCTLTEDGQRLEILDLDRRGIVLDMKQNQRCWSAAHLLCSWSATLFLHMQKAGFLMMQVNYDASYQISYSLCDNGQNVKVWPFSVKWIQYTLVLDFVSWTNEKEVLLRKFTEYALGFSLDFLKQYIILQKNI